MIALYFFKGIKSVKTIWEVKIAHCFSHVTLCESQFRQVFSFVF